MIATARLEDRVRTHTAPEVNHKIDDELDTTLSLYAHADRQLITRRIQQLDREWDIERVLETNASILALSGTLFGMFTNRKWLLLPTVVTGFLLQHALQGWCPPVPVFRRLGVRTRQEIEREKYALKALRGDFEGSASEGLRNGDSLLNTARP